MKEKEIVVEWRNCYIYGERYEVSNTGIVRNKVTGHILAPQKDKKGYLRVRLSLNDVKATAKVHRLVAVAFIPNPEGKPQVNHMDTNKQNNRVDNLEWATNSENQLHAYRYGLNHATGKAGRKKVPVCKVDLSTGEVLATYKSMADAGRENGLHIANICKVINGERSSTGGFGWIIEKGVVL